MVEGLVVISMWFPIIYLRVFTTGRWFSRRIFSAIIAGLDIQWEQLWCSQSWTWRNATSICPACRWWCDDLCWRVLFVETWTVTFAAAVFDTVNISRWWVKYLKAEFPLENNNCWRSWAAVIWTLHVHSTLSLHTPMTEGTIAFLSNVLMTAVGRSWWNGKPCPLPSLSNQLYACVYRYLDFVSCYVCVCVWAARLADMQDKFSNSTTKFHSSWISYLQEVHLGPIFFSIGGHRQSNYMDDSTDSPRGWKAPLESTLKSCSLEKRWKKGKGSRLRFSGLWNYHFSIQAIVT